MTFHLVWSGASSSTNSNDVFIPIGCEIRRLSRRNAITSLVAGTVALVDCGTGLGFSVAFRSVQFRVDLYLAGPVA